MEPALRDAAGPRRSPATLPGDHHGRPPRNKGRRYPADPPTVEEIVAVMRCAGDHPDGATVAWASADTGTESAARLEDPEFASRITAAMDARGALLAPMLADTLADLPFASALHIGGGPGVYARALLARRADLRAAVLERAPVDHAARTILLERGGARASGRRDSRPRSVG